MAFASISTGLEDAAREDAGRNIADWQTAHAELTRFAKARAGHEWEEGRLLLRAVRSGAHARLGFATFAEYVARWFGYNARLTTEKLRVAEALEVLPELSRELRQGELNGSVVRELTRVATAETERAWLEAARGRTARQVEALVSGHRPGNADRRRRGVSQLG